jgi:tRNA(Ile)-lysidine synthase
VGIAERVQEIALAWNVPCYLKVATSPIPETEAAARAWRYTQIAEVAIAIDCDRAVTGHTQSDRAETFLYNLIRGAGTDGLQALNWQRKLFEKIELIRPLLNISRRETFNFCQQLGLPIWEDAVNNNLKYARNRIRQELIPYLQANFNPQIEIQLCQTAELLTAEVEYLEDCARQCLEEAKSLDSRGLNRSYLRNLPLALQRRIVRIFLREELNKDPNFEQIEALIDLIDAPNQSRTSSLQKNKSAIVKSNIIYLELEN